MLNALEALISLLWRREMIHRKLSVTERRMEVKTQQNALLERVRKGRLCLLFAHPSHHMQMPWFPEPQKLVSL